MSSFSRDYVGSKAPGALFAILLTLAVNVSLFAVLAWVNKREVVREPEAPMITARRAFVRPKRDESRKEPKTNVKKTEVKTKAPKTTPRAKPLAKRPAPRRPKPTMPTIRASLPTMALNLQGNLALPIGDGGIVENTGDTQPSENDGIATNDGVDQPARATFAPSPMYPLSAKRLGHEGRVGIELIITDSGVAKNPRVVRSSGHRSLDKSALRALANWRFSPAVDDGEKVSVRGTITITFELEQ